MSRNVLAAFALALLFALPAGAQEWADKMFTLRVHDFGNVARGAKATFRFDFKNIYEEDLQIDSVTSQGSRGFADLGITPRGMEQTLQTLLRADMVA